ncbi:MAG: hypothetical protein P1P90_00940 [Patescibacteria group bacterium]|nr:hypothetical protein [Patescibacteria group bacterium]
MIRVTQTRDRDNEHFDQPTLEIGDPLVAALRLAQMELAYGARVTEASETRIVVKTRVFACVDTSVFEGTEEEMEPLVELVYFYLKAETEHGKEILDHAVSTAMSLPGGVGRKPFYLSMLTPLLLGGNKLKVALMLACGLRDEEQLKAGLQARLEDLVAAVQLQRDGLCSFQEALEL